MRSICAGLLVLFASLSLLTATPSRADAIGYYRWHRVPYYTNGYYNPYGYYGWGGYRGYPYYSSYRAYPWGWYW
jgi:hypothetical protein